jgi:5-methylthioribose kinase
LSVGTQLRLTPENLPEYLENRGLRAPGELARVEPAGDGNINWVRRVRLGSGSRSLVVKQARPALERFPEYEVTTERVVFEARYYEWVRPFDAAGLCPRVLDFDAQERVLVLEDLGDASRLDHALNDGLDPAAAAAAGAALGAFLGAVHAGTERVAGLAARFENQDMRRLHGDHIFGLPFHPNDFKLTAPLRARAEALWRDERAAAIAESSHRDYRSTHGVLVHGDVQGGNVLLQPDRPRLLDAEISHVGDAAFDMGILLAHLAVTAAAKDEPSRARPALVRAWEAYVAHRGQAPPFEPALRFAGIELVRRTLGAARLDVVADDAASLRVLDLGLRWMKAPALRPDLAL